VRACECSSGRAFPDLSAVSTNFQVVVDGVVMPVGGTSASTPTVAAMISMINSLRYHILRRLPSQPIWRVRSVTHTRTTLLEHSISQGKPTLGNINPALYAAWAQSAANYHDITTNQKQDTGCCPYSFSAVAGWYVAARTLVHLVHHHLSCRSPHGQSLGTR